MAAFKRPRLIKVVDQLPKTATGKVRRFALREELEALHPRGAPDGSSEDGHLA
jgi:acyl-coenzyme A synthetase/AMP-(fatty) acid ligase